MRFSGLITHDEQLRARLLGLFDSFRKKPADPERLAHLLLNEMWFYEENKKRAKDEPSAGDHRAKMNRFLSAMQAARQAWLDLPPIAHEVMHQNMPYTGSSLLPPSLLQQLQCASFFGQAPLLPDWRKPGLGEMQEWGADIEMLDLLQSLARHWMETHAPEPYARNRLELGYIRGIANVCEGYGIRKSNSERSQLARVVREMMRDREADYRQLIRAALSLGG